jgi:hypothetical protein
MRTRGAGPMHGRGRWMAAVLVTIVGMGLAGCVTPTSGTATGDGEVGPARVEAISGKDVKKVTLTEQAARRIGIATVVIGAGPVSAAPGGQPSTPETVVPYAAVLYDPKGATWVYTIPQPLTYVRERVVVRRVAGANGTEAVLSEGPPPGTTVVSTGAVELYGAELGVGK